MADETPKTLSGIASKRYVDKKKPFSDAVSDLVTSVANTIALRQFKQRKYKMQDAEEQAGSQ